MEEIWKSISGFDGLYEVSSKGAVRSMDRFLKSAGAKPRFWPSKLKRQTKDKDGYFVVMLYKENKPYNKKVHRLVAQAFIANEDGSAEVNHKNLEKTENNFSNLEWCSHQANIKHAVEGGRFHAESNINRSKIYQRSIGHGI